MQKMQICINDYVSFLYNRFFCHEAKKTENFGTAKKGTYLCLRLSTSRFPKGSLKESTEINALCALEQDISNCLINNLFLFMAKVGFWLNGSKGKLAGATLYKDGNGDTVMREVVSPSNPKTTAQLVQRIIMHTVMQAYSLTKGITDHSYEGLKKGQETMSQFMKENLNICRSAVASMQAQGVSMNNMYNFLPLGLKGFAPNQYLIAMGSLPQVKTQFITDAGSGIIYPTIQGITVNTYEGVRRAYGLKRGDQLTFCVITVSTTATGVGACQHHFCRVILDPTDPETGLPLTMETPFLDDNNRINKPSLRNEGTGDFAFQMTDGGALRFTYQSNGVYAAENKAACVIVSRRMGDEWQRSTTYLAYQGEGIGNSTSLGAALAAAQGSTNVVTGSDIYLNNAGEGGGSAASDSSAGGDSGSGSSDTGVNIISATFNGANMTVGTPASSMCAEGTTTKDVALVVNFADITGVSSIEIYSNNAIVGSAHPVSALTTNLSLTALPIGLYQVRVRKNDSLEQTGYQFQITAYQGGTGGGDAN